MKLKALTYLPAYSVFSLVIIGWAISWPIGKFALGYMPAIWLAGFRIAIATICIFILSGVSGKLCRPQLRDLPIILVIGILQFFLFTFLTLWGMQYVDAGNSAILAYTTPIWVAPMVWLCFRESLSMLNKTALLLAVIGIIILLADNSIRHTFNSTALFGDGLLVLAAVIWAISIICARYMCWHHSPLEIGAWQFLVATIIVLPICFFVAPYPIIHWTYHLLLALIYLSVVATGLGFWAFTNVAKQLPVMMTSSGLLAVPVLGLIASHWLLNESLSSYKLIAMGLILLALALTVISSRKV